MKAFIAILWLVTLCCWGYMLLMTHSAPGDTWQLRPAGLTDNLDHLLAFGLLGGLLSLSIWALLPRHPLLLGLALPALLVYAAADELTRPLVTPRTQLRHWLADAAGVAIAVACLYLFYGLSGVLRRSDPPSKGGHRPGLGMEVESALASHTEALEEVSERIIRVEKSPSPSATANPVRATARKAR